MDRDADEGLDSGSGPNTDDGMDSGSGPNTDEGIDSGSGTKSEQCHQPVGVTSIPLDSSSLQNVSSVPNSDFGQSLSMPLFPLHAGGIDSQDFKKDTITPDVGLGFTIHSQDQREQSQQENHFTENTIPIDLSLGLTIHSHVLRNQNHKFEDQLEQSQQKNQFTPADLRLGFAIHSQDQLEQSQEMNQFIENTVPTDLSSTMHSQGGFRMAGASTKPQQQIQNNLDSSMTQQSTQQMINYKRVDDGYNWKHYRWCQYEGGALQRFFFNCTEESCTVKKIVEQDEKECTINILGKHNHVQPRAGKFLKVAVAGRSMSRNACNTSNNEGMGNEPDTNSRNADAIRVSEGPASASPRKSRLSVFMQAFTQEDVYEDEYQWRECEPVLPKKRRTSIEQKKFFTCAYPGCKVLKICEVECPGKLKTTYKDMHYHDVPAATEKPGQQEQQNDSQI